MLFSVVLVGCAAVRGKPSSSLCVSRVLPPRLNENRRRLKIERDKQNHTRRKEGRKEGERALSNSREDLVPKTGRRGVDEAQPEPTYHATTLLLVALVGAGGPRLQPGANAAAHAIIYIDRHARTFL